MSSLSFSKRVSIRALGLWMLVFLCSIYCLQAAPAEINQDLPEKIPEPGPVNFSTLPSCKDEAILQLRSMIENDYEHWTGSKSRPLTLKQIGSLQRNPKLKYAQAVLLGVLALTIDHGHGFVDRLDYDKVMALANGESICVSTSPALDGNAPDLNEAQTFTFRNLVINYRKFFDNLLSNLSPSGYKIWGREKMPGIDGLQQGPVGNCYWLSAVEAVVQKHPEIVMQTIKQLSPDRFELQFRGQAQTIEVTLTHGEMSQLSLDPQDGCWLTILALGEAKVREQEPDLPGFWLQTPLGVVAHSGSQKQVLELLTGEKYLHVYMKETPLEKIAAILRRTTRERMPVGLSTSDHCLSICDFNSETKMLTILNPAGTSSIYQIGESGISVLMENGIFELPLSEARRAFYSLTIPAAAREERE